MGFTSLLYLSRVPCGTLLLQIPCFQALCFQCCSVKKTINKILVIASINDNLTAMYACPLKNLGQIRFDSDLFSVGL